MAAFTVRVELRGYPTSEDYDALHQAMEGAGFARTITGEAGVERHLPTAEYNFLGTQDKYGVLERAKRAAARTSKNYSVLVTESNGRTWFNLPEV